MGYFECFLFLLFKQYYLVFILKMYVSILLYFKTFLQTKVKNILTYSM